MFFRNLEASGRSETHCAVIPHRSHVQLEMAAQHVLEATGRLNSLLGRASEGTPHFKFLLRCASEGVLGALKTSSFTVREPFCTRNGCTGVPSRPWGA